MHMRADKKNFYVLDFSDFSTKSRKNEILKKNQLFEKKISREATESSFHRKIFIYGLFERFVPKVFVYKKIKFFPQPEPS